MYCKQYTQPNLTRPSLDTFCPLGLFSRACPIPQIKPFICNDINSFSPCAIANMHQTSGASMFMTESTAIHRLSHLKATSYCQECPYLLRWLSRWIAVDSASLILQQKSSVSIRFTICHEHACAACLTHVCYCIWRKWVNVIANEGFGLGYGTSHAEESKRTKRVQGWSHQIGLGTLFAIHCKLFSISCLWFMLVWTFKLLKLTCTEWGSAHWGCKFFKLIIKIDQLEMTKSHFFNTSLKLTNHK